jgi:hypothetical protein
MSIYLHAKFAQIEFIGEEGKNQVILKPLEMVDDFSLLYSLGTESSNG